MVKVHYSSNNSGGSWWLDDDDWNALATAGWDVEWAKDKDPRFIDENGRWLGALATRASKDFPTLRDGMEEWARLTGENPGDLGCQCCGAPHYFGTDEGDSFDPDDMRPASVDW